jgi:COMPASS component SWD2
LIIFKGHQNTKNVPLEASFSPDSKYVFCGSTDGRVHVWRTTDGEKLTTFTTDNSSECIQCVQFNPKLFMLATASTNMVRIKKNYSSIEK